LPDKKVAKYYHSILMMSNYISSLISLLQNS
jgi:hypothetical protein